MIIDTNFIIQVNNNHPGAREKVKELEREGVSLRVPDIVVFELWISVGKGENTEENKNELEKVINNLPRVKTTREIVKKAGRIEGRLQASDENDSGVGSGDAIIAATALIRDEPVMTDDRSDFVRRIKREAGETHLDVRDFRETGE